MNGNKGFLVVIIAILVLSMVACGLATALVFQCINAVDGRWENRDNDWDRNDEFQFDFSPIEPPVAEAPIEAETPAVAEPVEMGDPLGILVPDEGDFNMRILESFDAVCQEQGIASILFVGSTGDPMELFDAAISMLENDGVSGIAICNMDPEVTEELAAVAAAYNVPVISIDAAMDVPPPEGVVAHIDSWGSVEDIAFKLLWAMTEVTGGNSSTGRFGVVTPFDSDSIYDSMEQQIGQYDRFENTVWRASGHGNGTDESCRESIIYMLEHYDLDALICTEPQTTNAAIIAMEELGMDIPIVAYTHPSMVADIGGSNVTAIWHDPRAAGELAARSLIGAITGNVVFEEGAFVYLGNGDSYRMETLDGVLNMWVTPLWITEDNADALRNRE